jgi:hypothetical protein
MKSNYRKIGLLQCKLGPGLCLRTLNKLSQNDSSFPNTAKLASGGQKKKERLLSGAKGLEQEPTGRGERRTALIATERRIRGGDDLQRLDPARRDVE